jgi:DNA end-binding protein Ku
MVEEFKPEKYEDEYKRDLLKLINKKAKAGEINRIPEVAETKPHRPHTAQIIDLAGLLASSLKQGRGSANRTQGDDDERPRRLSKTRSARKKAARGEHHKKSA